MALWDHLWVCVAREEKGWDGSWLARWEKHEFKVLPSAESRKQAAEAISVCTIYWLCAARVLLVRPISPSRGSHLSLCPTAVLLRSRSPGGLHFCDEGISQIGGNDTLSRSVNEKKNPQASAMLLHMHVGRPRAGISLLCPCTASAPHPFTQKYGQTGLGNSWYGYAPPREGVAGGETSGRWEGGMSPAGVSGWQTDSPRQQD